MILAAAVLLGAAPASGPAGSTSAPSATAPFVAPIKGKLGTPVPLFNGKDLAGWSWHSSTANSKIDEAWSVKDGILRLGTKPTGFIDTDKSYKNFVLTAEQRHMPGATTRDNGGFFVCIAGEETQWPNAVQIQGKFGSVGDLINQNSGMKQMTTDPARTAKVNKDVVITKINKDVEHPAGEWDTVVITMENGQLWVTVNGKLQNTATDISPDAGKIGIQSEGYAMEFRKIELTPIEP